MNPFLALRFNRVRYRSKVSPTAPSFWEGSYFLNIPDFFTPSEPSGLGKNADRERWEWMWQRVAKD
jgi:hypothetical protein